MVRLDATTLGRGFVTAGLVHLLAPNALLAAARYAYKRFLAVDLDVDDRAERRVRAVGLAMLATGTVVASDDRSLSVALERS